MHGHDDPVARIEARPAEIVAVDFTVLQNIIPRLQVNLDALPRGAARQDRHISVCRSKNFAVPQAIWRSCFLVSDEINFLNSWNLGSEGLKCANCTDVDIRVLAAPVLAEKRILLPGSLEEML